MALSGSLHLFLGDELETVRDIKTISLGTDLSKEEITSLFESELKSINTRFDYIKGSSTSLVTRPTSRTYHSIKVSGNEAKIQEHNPSIRKSLMELHMGHGARATRNILGLLGILAIFSVLSGLWLGLSSKAYRKITMATISCGAIVYFLLFFL